MVSESRTKAGTKPRREMAGPGEPAHVLTPASEEDAAQVRSSRVAPRVLRKRAPLPHAAFPHTVLEDDARQFESVANSLTRRTIFRSGRWYHGRVKPDPPGEGSGRER